MSLSCRENVIHIIYVLEGHTSLCAIFFSLAWGLIGYLGFASILINQDWSSASLIHIYMWSQQEF